MRAAGLLLIAQSLALIGCIAHYAGQVAEHRAARMHAEAAALRLSLELENTTGQRDALGQAYSKLRRHNCGA